MYVATPPITIISPYERATEAYEVDMLCCNGFEEFEDLDSSKARYWSKLLVDLCPDTRLFSAAAELN